MNSTSDRPLPMPTLSSERKFFAGLSKIKNKRPISPTAVCPFFVAERSVLGSGPTTASSQRPGGDRTALIFLWPPSRLDPIRHSSQRPHVINVPHCCSLSNPLDVVPALAANTSSLSNPNHLPPRSASAFSPGGFFPRRPPPHCVPIRPLCPDQPVNPPACADCPRAGT